MRANVLAAPPGQFVLELGEQVATAPFPIAPALHESGAYRIGEHISSNLNDILFGPQRVIVERPLPDWPRR